MYDTLHMWLEWSKVEQLDLTQTINILSNTKEYRSKDNNSLIGKLNNFRVTINETGISLKGSLAKYYYGNNFETLTRDDTKKAIEKLSADLYLPMQLSKITRLDFGANLILNYPVSSYISFLGDKRYFKRVQATKTSLYYNTIKKRINIYDKIKEAKSKKSYIPDYFKRKNVLRYELRFEKRVSEQFNRPELIASTLYDEDFFKSLINILKQEYDSIQKINKLDVKNVKEIKTPNDGINALCGALLNKAGLDTITNFITDIKAKNVYKYPKYYSIVNSKLKDLANNTQISMQNEFISELDIKIKNLL
ncbi:MAG: phage/plasmid replication protein [Bacteroidales bacterium]|jgi:hypothetical protein|nr:phage/plasmid replication protein [Bacteroidales bacterium]